MKRQLFCGIYRLWSALVSLQPNAICLNAYIGGERYERVCAYREYTRNKCVYRVVNIEEREILVPYIKPIRNNVP